jgi:hypothetical protein
MSIKRTAIPESVETNEHVFESFENSPDEMTRFMLSMPDCTVAPAGATPGGVENETWKELLASTDFAA